MLLKISLPLAIILGLSACSESNFKGGTKVGAPAPKAADVIEDENVVIAPTPDVLPVPEPKPVIELKDKCEAGVGAKVLEQKISFAERRGCDFDADGIARVDAVITTMKTSTAAIKLPPGEVCDMSLESDGDINFRYDDILIFSLDQNVLFSSTENIKPKFKMSGDFLQWNKDELVGFRVDFDGRPYCIGGADSCKMPQTDTPGKIALTFPFASVGPMIQLYKGKSEVPLLLTATGDNDAQDCSHSQLDLVVKMKYVP